MKRAELEMKDWPNKGLWGYYTMILCMLQWICSLMPPSRYLEYDVYILEAYFTADEATVVLAGKEEENAMRGCERWRDLL